MSADKIKGPIVIFTKAKKNSHAPQGLELLDLSWEQASGIWVNGGVSAVMPPVEVVLLA